MNYTPTLFSLPNTGVFPGSDAPKLYPYVFDDNIAVCVDVALATDRPLLVSGPPGSGKSTLAPVIAQLMGRRFLSATFKSRTRLEELQGDYDNLRRLNDAQAAITGERARPREAYLEPGVLWWAFSEESARQRGMKDVSIDPDEPAPQPPDGFGEGVDTVVLLDEVDKADPDLPNDLLDPLELRAFTIAQGPRIEAPESAKILIVITTNRERELSPAFVRRCICLHIDHPNEDRLVSIANQRFSNNHESLHIALATKLIDERDEALAQQLRAPGVSEYLDAIAACRELNIEPQDDNPVWQTIRRATLAKERTGDGVA